MSFEDDIRSTVPLKILVIDPDDSTRRLLVGALQRIHDVVSVKPVKSLDEAKAIFVEEEINAIYIDLLSLELEASTNFVFDMRRNRPDIVFVLYVDVKQAEEPRHQFYSGVRRRFYHYFKLDKLAESATFFGKVAFSVEQVQGDLRMNLRMKEVTASLDRASSYVKGKEIKETVSNIRRDVKAIPVAELRTRMTKATKKLEEQVKQLHRKVDEEIGGVRKMIGATKEFQDFRIFSTDLEELKRSHIHKDVVTTEIKRLDEKIDKTLENLKTGMKALNTRIEDLKAIKFLSIRTIIEIALAILAITTTLFAAGILKF